MRASSSRVFSPVQKSAVFGGYVVFGQTAEFALSRPHVSKLQTEDGAALNQQSYSYEGIEIINAAIANSYGSPKLVGCSEIEFLILDSNRS
jgi:hypothetical protein